MGLASGARPPRPLDMLLVALASLSWRVFSCEYMMLADQDHKWMASKLLLQQGVLADWSQHTLRWTSTLPLFAVNFLFGFNPALYYVWPILLGTLSALFVYCIAAKAYGRFPGIAFAVAAVVFPPMVSAGSQLEPTANMLPFVLGALYCVMRWDETNRTRWLALAGVSLFLGYGAKINALIYAVPIGAYVFSAGFKPGAPAFPLRSGLKNVAAFASPLFGGMLLEGVLLYLVSGFPYGRILLEMKGAASDAIRMQGYGYSGFEYSGFWDLMASARELLGFDVFQKLSILGGLAASVFVLLCRVRFLYLFAACFVFDFLVTTYMVRSVNPLILAQPHYARYYIVLCMLGALMAGLLLYGAAAGKHGLSVKKGMAFAAVLLALTVLAAGKEDYWRLRKDAAGFLARENGIARTLENDRLIREAERDNKDIAIEINAACDAGCNLKEAENLSINGVARVHSFWSYYGRLDAKPDFDGLCANRVCSKADPGKLWVFPFAVRDPGDRVVLVGRDGGVRYEWSLFNAKDYVRPANSPCG